MTLSQGAHIINDIFGGSTDLFDLSKKYKNGLVLMHTPAAPKIMQQKTTEYKDVVEDVKKFLASRKKYVELRDFFSLLFYNPKNFKKI